MSETTRAPKRSTVDIVAERDKKRAERQAKDAAQAEVDQWASTWFKDLSDTPGATPESLALLGLMLRSAYAGKKTS